MTMTVNRSAVEQTVGLAQTRKNQSNLTSRAAYPLLPPGDCPLGFRARADASLLKMMMATSARLMRIDLEIAKGGNVHLQPDEDEKYRRKEAWIGAMMDHRLAP